MDKDVFYAVTVPKHEELKVDHIGMPGHYTTEYRMFNERQVWIPERPTSYRKVIIPEKKYHFEKRKKAKSFCLENGYPLSYVTEELI